MNNIKARIKKANKAMGELKFFLNAPEVSSHTKYLIYMAILFHLLLRGSKSRATNLDVLRNLKYFILDVCEVFYVLVGIM